MRAKTWIWGTFLLAAALVAPAGLEGSTGGITGFSGAGGATCSVCHSGGIVPTVAISGPTTVAPGTIHTYSLTIAGGQQVGGGFNVSANTGTLIVSDPGTWNQMGPEITHNDVRNAVGGVVTFTFDWEAPALPGQATIFGAGNSVNDNGNNDGDAASTDQLQISVQNVAAGTPGESSAPGLQPLLVSGFNSLTGDLTINYESGCDTDNNNLYYGPLDQVSNYNWTDEICDIGALGFATVNPGSGSFFFVVVGNKNGDEGSYGRDSDGVERSSILLNVCGESQDLSNTCIP